MTQERTPVSPEAEAAAIYAACDRIDATAAKMLAAAREAGRLEGDAAGYRRGMEEAIRILDALPRGVERIRTGTTLDMNTSAQAYLTTVVRVPTVDEGAAAIRAKMEGK